MKITHEIQERKVTFTEVTAIWSGEPEAGRRYAVLIHDETDTYHNGDGVIFEIDLPETKEDAEIILQNETMITDQETLETIKTY